MIGFEPRTSEATALPTEPQTLSTVSSLLLASWYSKIEMGYLGIMQINDGLYPNIGSRPFFWCIHLYERSVTCPKS